MTAATLTTTTKLDRIRQVYSQPFPTLMFEAQTVHRLHHNPLEMQLATLGNIKTGACPEDCGYCAQSVHNQADLKPEPLMQIEPVLEEARAAKEAGATRFCMGAAWREVKDGSQFDRVLEMVTAVASLDMEVCCTLGMLKPHQAAQLKQAGLTAYNHNLDTSPAYYDKIISTRTYQDRLDTIAAVSAAGISVCCGGIVGMGETETDRLEFLEALTKLDPAPESIPINCLIPIAGTPLENSLPVDPIELVRLIATTRILFPTSMVRLTAGRTLMSDELQTLCFLAGANSIFTGSVLLTAPNPTRDHDRELLAKLDIYPKTL